MTDTPTVNDVVRRLAELSRIRDQIEVGRSLNSAIKAEWAAGNVGQP